MKDTGQESFARKRLCPERGRNNDSDGGAYRGSFSKGKQNKKDDQPVERGGQKEGGDGNLETRKRGRLEG